MKKLICALLAVLMLFLICTAATLWLQGCTSLEHIRFKPQSISFSIDFYWCQSLDNDSVDSIIDGLADLTGREQLKVTFHSTVMNNMTTEQYNKIIAKNWAME